MYICGGRYGNWLRDVPLFLILLFLYLLFHFNYPLFRESFLFPIFYSVLSLLNSCDKFSETNSSLFRFFFLFHC